MKKIKNIKQTQQVNGAVTGASIYDIIGKKTFPYNEKTLEEYSAKLKTMDWSDLQKHAVEVANILPNVDRRDRLINKLEQAFLKKLYAFVGHGAQATPSTASAEVMNILRKGGN